jgi:hypothetical protein
MRQEVDLDLDLYHVNLSVNRGCDIHPNQPITSGLQKGATSLELVERRVTKRNYFYFLKGVRGGIDEIFFVLPPTPCQPFFITR